MKWLRFYLDILKQNCSDHPTVPEAGVHTTTNSASKVWSEIFDTLRDTIWLRNYSPKTYSTYAGWIGRFELFVKEKPPADVTMTDVKAFLTRLAVHSNVSASTQNQAFNALLFLFRHILVRCPRSFILMPDGIGSRPVNPVRHPRNRRNPSSPLIFASRAGSIQRE